MARKLDQPELQCSFDQVLQGVPVSNDDAITLFLSCCFAGDVSRATSIVKVVRSSVFRDVSLYCVLHGRDTPAVSTIHLNQVLIFSKPELYVCNVSSEQFWLDRSRMLKSFGESLAYSYEIERH